MKQIQTLSKQGAHLVTNRKVTMFITIIGTAIIATFQLFTVILGKVLFHDFNLKSPILIENKEREPC